MDECKFNISDCDVNANCTNTFGSYKCTCKVGYIGDGRSCSGNFEDDLIDISQKKLSFVNCLIILSSVTRACLCTDLP